MPIVLVPPLPLVVMRLYELIESLLPLLALFQVPKELEVVPPDESPELPFEEELPLAMNE